MYHITFVQVKFSFHVLVWYVSVRPREVTLFPVSASLSLSFFLFLNHAKNTKLSIINVRFCRQLPGNNALTIYHLKTMCILYLSISEIKPQKFHLKPACDLNSTAGSLEANKPHWTSIHICTTWFTSDLKEIQPLQILPVHLQWTYCHKVICVSCGTASCQNTSASYWWVTNWLFLEITPVTF